MASNKTVNRNANMVASPVTVVEFSDNSKIGLMSATYATQATCPATCKLRGAGCYAETSFVGITTRRLNATAAAGNWTVEEIAELEAAGIRRLHGVLPLRLHVVGDATTNAAAGILASAAREHTAKHGREVYSYTHAWRDVSAASWRGVSILASCENAADVRDAQAAGYATALVVESHASTKAYWVDGMKVIPCPSQTKDVTCADCKLCMRSDMLKATGASIGLAVHGSGAKKAAAALVTIQAAG